MVKQEQSNAFYTTIEQQHQQLDELLTHYDKGRSVEALLLTKAVDPEKNEMVVGKITGNTDVYGIGALLEGLIQATPDIDGRRQILNVLAKVSMNLLENLPEPDVEESVDTVVVENEDNTETILDFNKEN